MKRASAEGQIVEMYRSGLTSYQVGAAVGVSQYIVLKAVRKAGIVRSPYDARRSRFPVRHNCFSTLSPESEYWIGYMMADGHVTQNRGYWVVALNSNDVEHLGKFQTFTGAINNKLILNNKQWGCYKILITSDTMARDLIRWGVTPRKSLTAVVPIELERSVDFWRGYMDGNGHVGVRIQDSTPQVNLCAGSQAIIEQAANFFAEIAGRRPAVYVRNGGRACQLHLWSGGAARLCAALYSTSTLHLDRKFAKAQAIIAIGRKRGHL